MNNLAVLTTATPRAELFEEGLYPTLKFLSQDFKLFWFVNLDAPPMLSLQDFEVAKSSILNFVKTNNIKGALTTNTKTPNFGVAAQTVFKKASASIPFDFYMWLEDDWKLENETAYRIALYKYIEEEKDFLLSMRPYVCGNPFIFKHEFFKEVVEGYQDRALDPELMFFYQRQIQRNGKSKKTPEKNSIQANYFVDIGRDWRANRKIIKQNKHKNPKNTWT